MPTLSCASCWGHLQALHCEKRGAGATFKRTSSWVSCRGAAASASAARRTGCCRDMVASCFTCSVMVALNSIVCRLRGASFTISLTCNCTDHSTYCSGIISSRAGMGYQYRLFTSQAFRDSFHAECASNALVPGCCHAGMPDVNFTQRYGCISC